jgi:hypothetical protein
MKLTVVRTETQAKQRKKEKQNMAITLSDIHNAFLDYFSSRIVTSINVGPEAGQQHINPDEQFGITLTVKNSVDDPDQGVQINNVCYHVSVDDPSKALLIVPETSVAVARESASSSSATVKPKEERQELFLFPPDNSLTADDTDFRFIQGHALVAGEPKLSFHVHGDVDLGTLFPPNQKSPNANQTVEIEQS